MERGILRELEKHASAEPGREALRHGSRFVTYGELWEAVRRICGFCRRTGIGRGARVLLALPNGIDFVFAYYGFQAAGNVVVPCSPEGRPTQLVQLARRCKAKLLITQCLDDEWRRLLGAVPSLATVLTLSRPPVAPAGTPIGDWAEVFAFEPADPAPSIDRPKGLAVLACTSGTTGTSKLVKLSRGNLAANTRSVLDYLNIGNSDSGLCILPLHYAYGASILNTHLVAGARLVLGKGSAYPQQVRRWLESERISLFFGVPTTYYQLLEHKVFDAPLPHLRLLGQAGGGMRPDAVDQVRGKLPGVRFFVMYGQTEATARLSFVPPERWPDKRGSIGIPIPGVELSLRHKDGSLTPPGRIGEICARGDNITPGYWDDREATARILRGGWLHTGDLAWRDEEGYYYLVGRADEMIKSGGYRFSPDVVEEVLAGHPEVARVAVVGVPHPLLGHVVRAVVVLHPGRQPNRSGFMQYCREHLPPYMLPKQLLFSAELPMTESGKIKRQALASEAVSAGQGNR